MLKDKLDGDLGIKDLNKCDFDPIRQYLDQQKVSRALGHVADVLHSTRSRFWVDEQEQQPRVGGGVRVR